MTEHANYPANSHAVRDLGIYYASVAWLERDYDAPGRFAAPPDHAAMNARGIFQIKDDHETACGWDGCGNERDRLLDFLAALPRQLKEAAR